MTREVPQSVRETLHSRVPAAPTTVAEEWKRAKCPPAAEWIRKTWCGYTVERCPATKGQDLVICNTDLTHVQKIRGDLLKEKRIMVVARGWEEWGRVAEQELS